MTPILKTRFPSLTVQIYRQTQAVLLGSEVFYFHCLWYKSFVSNRSQPSRPRTVLTRVKKFSYVLGKSSSSAYSTNNSIMFFFHKQYSAEANIILTGPTVLCLREAVLFVCGQCLRIQISEDVFLIWEEFLWTQKVSTLQRPTALFEYTAYIPNSYVHYFVLCEKCVRVQKVMCLTEAILLVRIQFLRVQKLCAL
jgi:hypothetical protein